MSSTFEPCSECGIKHSPLLPCPVTAPHGGDAYPSVAEQVIHVTSMHPWVAEWVKDQDPAFVKLTERLWERMALVAADIDRQEREGMDRLHAKLEAAGGSSKRYAMVELPDDEAEGN